MKKQAHSLSVRLLLSYLSLLAVPLAAICIVYYTASELLYKVQQEKTLAMLQTTAVEMQQSLAETANLGVYISSAREFTQIQQLLRRENRRATFYEMYELSRVFPNYSLFNGAVRDVYFFFDEQDYVVRLPAVVPATERSYASLGQLLADDYESLQTMLSEEYREMQTLTFSSREEERKLLGVAQSFPYGASESPLGTVLIVLDDSMLRAKLATNLWNNCGITVMLNSSGRVVNQIVGANTKPLPDDFSFEALSRNPFSEIRIDGESYTVCCAQTDTRDYTFYTMMPTTVLRERIGGIRYLIVLLCILSGCVSVAICLVLWYRRRALVLRYYRYETEFGHVGAPYTGFWDIVRAVFDSMAEMQRTVKHTLEMNHSAVIQRLLYGKYSSEDALRQTLAEAGIVLEGSGYYAVAIRLKRAMGALQNQSLAEFHAQVRTCVKQYISLPHYFCEPEDMMLALVVPARTETSLRTLKDELHTLEDALVAEEQLESFVGIGMCVSQLGELADSYTQASAVCDYLQYYNIRLVMEYANLPQSTETFFFPMETELSLIRVIEQANGSALRELFRVITYENYTARTLSPEMQSHLVNLVRCTAIRALRGAVQPETLHLLGKAETLDIVLKLLESALPDLQQVNERQSVQQSENKKERYAQQIETNYMRSDYTIGCLAQAMQMSETKLYKEFRAIFGASFSEYLENIRIYNACALLREGVTVKDVAVKVGYSSDYSFRRAFKRVMGLAPSYYLESLDK